MLLPRSGCIMKTKRTMSSVLLLILKYVLILLAGFITIAPFLWMLSTSLQPNLKAIFQRPPNFIPKPATWSNYLTAWKSAPFGTYMFNSIYVSSIVTILQLFTSALAAYVFTQFQFKFRETLFIFYLLVMMIPSQVTVVPLYSLLSSLNWLDTYWGLIVPFAGNALGVFLLRQAFRSIPKDLPDAAIIDGCSHARILFSVMLPLVKPSAVAFALIAFKWKWNDYFWTLILTSTDKMRTLPVGISAMKSGPEGGSQWNIVMAATMIVILPMIVIFLVAQKYFVKGVTHSGLKG